MYRLPLYSQIKQTLKKSFPHQAPPFGKDLCTNNKSAYYSSCRHHTGAKAKCFTVKAVSHTPGAISSTESS